MRTFLVMVISLFFLPISLHAQTSPTEKSIDLPAIDIEDLCKNAAELYKPYGKKLVMSDGRVTSIEHECQNAENSARNSILAMDVSDGDLKFCSKFALSPKSPNTYVLLEYCLLAMSDSKASHSLAESGINYNADQKLFPEFDSKTYCADISNYDGNKNPVFEKKCLKFESESRDELKNMKVTKEPALFCTRMLKLIDSPSYMAYLLCLRSYEDARQSSGKK